MSNAVYDYPETWRKIAGKQVFRTKPEFPDFSLGIGVAEDHAPKKLVYKARETNRSMRADIEDIRTFDDLLAINLGMPLRGENFPIEFYMGEVIE